MTLKNVISNALAQCAGARLDKPEELALVADVVLLSITKTDEARTVRREAAAAGTTYPRFVRAAAFLSGEP